MLRLPAIRKNEPIKINVVNHYDNINKIGMLSFTAPLQFEREIQNLKSKIQNPITHDPFLFALFEPCFEEQILLLNRI